METLLTLGLVALIAAAVTAMHLRLTAPPTKPVTAWSTDDIDAEFLRIIDRVRSSP